MLVLVLVRALVLVLERVLVLVLATLLMSFLTNVLSLNHMVFTLRLRSFARSYTHPRAPIELMFIQKYDMRIFLPLVNR